MWRLRLEGTPPVGASFAGLAALRRSKAHVSHFGRCFNSLEVLSAGSINSDPQTDLTLPDSRNGIKKLDIHLIFSCVWKSTLIIRSYRQGWGQETKPRSHTAVKLTGRTKQVPWYREDCNKYQKHLKTHWIERPSSRLFVGAIGKAVAAVISDYRIL